MNTPEQIEEEYVHKFYDRLAIMYPHIRMPEWQSIYTLLHEYTTDESLILDVGCGYGRAFIRPNTIGLDTSLELLKQVSKPNVGLLKADACLLPFRDNIFDAVLSIGTIHHLSTSKRRLDSLLEMKRVLKNNGIGVIYVFMREGIEECKHVRISNDDYFTTWNGKIDGMKYYYAFDQKSLKALCHDAGLNVLKCEIEHMYQNIIVVVQKDSVCK